MIVVLSESVRICDDRFDDAKISRGARPGQYNGTWYACYLSNQLIPYRSVTLSTVITRQRGSSPQRMWIASSLSCRGWISCQRFQPRDHYSQPRLKKYDEETNLKTAFSDSIFLAQEKNLDSAISVIW